MNYHESRESEWAWWVSAVACALALVILIVRPW